MDRGKLIAVAAGRERADLVIKNAGVFDVYGGSVIKGDVAVTGGVIAGVGKYSGKEEIDGGGKYVMPSFCDAHLHFESAAVRPSEYLKLAVPHGVTAFIADPHEIANVCGMRGIEFMRADVRGIPADVRFMMPSCVPATPEDSSGACLTAADAEEGKRAGLYGLGEMMNVPGVLSCDPDVLAKLDVFDRIDGHAPGLGGEGLNAYAAAGISTDHECTTAEEAAERVSRGMYVLMREGSQAKNVRDLLPAVTERNMRRFMFCSDDRNLDDVTKRGTIDDCVRIAVECGVDPVSAVAMAALNPSEAYGLRGRGAVAPGMSADLVISRDIAAREIEAVYYRGTKVAENGRALFKTSPADAAFARGTVRLAPFGEDDFSLPFYPGMPVIGVSPRTLVTRLDHAESAEGLDLLCCMERHRASGEIGRAYVSGFGLRGGAIASTVGHDSHNVAVIGDNARDMAAAVRALAPDGGLAVCSGGKATKAALDIAGLMSSRTAEEALAERRALLSALDELCREPGIEPFMLLSFLTLTVIPEAKLNTKGLYDVAHGAYVYRG